MATKKPLKITSGKRARFVTGDTIGVDNGGTNLSTIAANSLLGALTLDTYSAISLPLSAAYGGTGVDLSATGGATNVLAQAAGGVISSRALIAADIPNLPASIITSGQIAVARLGTGTPSGATILYGDGTWGAPSGGTPDSLSTITAGTLTVPLNLGTQVITSTGSPTWYTATGQSIKVGVNSVPLLSLGSSYAVQGDSKWAIGAYGTGSTDGTKSGIVSSSATDMSYNANTAGSHYFAINNVTMATLGRAFNVAGSGSFAIGLYGASAVDATKAGIASDAATALYLNVATGGTITGRVNNVTYLSVASATTSIGDTSSGSHFYSDSNTARIKNTSATQFQAYTTDAYIDRSGALYIRTSAGTNKYKLADALMECDRISLGGTLGSSVDPGAGGLGVVGRIQFTGAGTFSSSLSQIAASASGGYIRHDVPTGMFHGLYVAGVAKFTVDGTYLTTPNILKFSGGAGNIGYIVSDSTGLLLVNNALTKAFFSWVESGTTLTLSDGNSGESSVVCSPTEAALVYGTTARISVGSTAVTMSGGQINTSSTTKTTTYTLTTSDYIVFGNHATTAFTLTLPAATATGRVYIIKNIGAAVVTVAGNAAELIDASNTQALTLNASITIIDHATGQWRII